MPRTARETSHTGVYHAILRGVNKQQIFECSEDYQRFLQILRTQTQPEEYTLGQKQPPHCTIYAYCQMGNHVHLLIKQNSETLGETMKRITSSYVYYYNHKYGRIGHIFQEHFKSQPVNDWQYFLTLLRYIHQNPLKPNLVRDLKDYPWSSWLEYMGTQTETFCATHIVLQRIPLAELTQLVIQPLTEDEESGLLDIEETPVKTYFTDQEIRQVLTNLCGVSTLSDFQKLPRLHQKHILREAHEKGIGPRALSRLTGVPYSIVQRATSKANEQKQHYTSRVCEDIAPYGIKPEEQCAEEEYLTYCDEDEFAPYLWGHWFRNL